MPDQADRTFAADFKRFFVKGLAVLLPTVLTLWILVKAYEFVDGAIAQPINAGIRYVMLQATPHSETMAGWFDPTEEMVTREIAARARDLRSTERIDVVTDLREFAILEWWRDRWYMEFIGLVVAIVSVYIAGRLLGGFLGRRIYGRLEAFFTRIPIIKQVYPSVKQIVDFLISDEKPIKFNRVVVVEYPRKGIWAIGLVTGGTMKAIETTSGPAMTIFIPSSPTPFTGYTITVPRDSVIEVPISIDEALRFTISGGVLVPKHQATPDRGDEPSNDDGVPPGLPPGEATSPSPN